MSRMFSTLFLYKKPRLAAAAVASVLFVMAFTLGGEVHLEKFGFLLGSGLGVYFLIMASKAMRHQFGNLAVLMFVSGLVMLVLGVLFTSETVHATSSVEDLVPSIVGGIGGMFTSVDEA